MPYAVESSSESESEAPAAHVTAGPEDAMNTSTDDFVSPTAARHAVPAATEPTLPRVSSNEGAASADTPANHDDDDEDVGISSCLVYVR